MKIKLSKSQWEGIGKKAGWMKVAQMSQSEMNQEETDYENFMDINLKDTALFYYPPDGDRRSGKLIIKKDKSADFETTDREPIEE